MSKQTEALKLALEALEETRNGLAWFYYIYPQDVTEKGNELLPHVETVLAAIREALAEQPEQEPVAWLIWLHGPADHFDHKQFAEMEFERRNKEYPDPDRKLLSLYTSPPASKPWVGLTDEDRALCVQATVDSGDAVQLMRAIEAKLREKNA